MTIQPHEHDAAIAKILHPMPLDGASEEADRYRAVYRAGLAAGRTPVADGAPRDLVRRLRGHMTPASIGGSLNFEAARAIEELLDANARFAVRNLKDVDRMFELEQERDALLARAERAEKEAAALREAVRKTAVGWLSPGMKCCLLCGNSWVASYPDQSHAQDCLAARKEQP